MQFVDFAAVKAETASEGPSRRDAMFALRSLMEIPDQFKVRPAVPQSQFFSLRPQAVLMVCIHHTIGTSADGTFVLMISDSDVSGFLLLTIAETQSPAAQSPESQGGAGS